MDEYLLKYNNLNKKIVFKFGILNGGIGDLTKFFTYLLQLCIKHDIKLCYLINSEIDKFFRLKYENMYISSDKIFNSIEINNENDIINISSSNDNFHIIKPMSLYSVPEIEKKIEIPLNDIFYFTPQVINKADNFISNKEYISIHLRLGDRFLETERKNINCYDDIRKYDENKIYEIIENNYDKLIIFFCDNKQYKKKLKNKYNKILITDFDIGHTGLYNTTEIQIFNTVVEFYLLSNSTEIYACSKSGFSQMASKIKNINELNILY